MQQRTEELRPLIVRTPVTPLNSALISQVLGGSIVHLKMECFQHTGTFKARGALSVTQSIRQRINDVVLQLPVLAITLSRRPGLRDSVA